MNAAVTALISPLGTWLAVSLLGLLLIRRHRVRAGVTIMSFAALWLCVWATPAASEWLEERVESQFPPLAVNAVPQAQAIVVLGGGIAPPTRTNPYANLAGAADRVWHAARLYNAGKAPLVLLSGGGDRRLGTNSEAEAMRTFAIDLGVPDSALVLESTSRTTHENATSSADVLKARGVQRILLVTSALHMSRALSEFRAVGLDVVPAATDHDSRVPLSLLRAWLPNAQSLDASARAFKEIAGGWVAGR